MVVTGFFAQWQCLLLALPNPFSLEINCVWFKHILFRRKGLDANATMPSPEQLQLCLNSTNNTVLTTCTPDHLFSPGSIHFSSLFSCTLISQNARTHTPEPISLVERVGLYYGRRRRTNSSYFIHYTFLTSYRIPSIRRPTRFRCLCSFWRPVEWT